PEFKQRCATSHDGILFGRWGIFLATASRLAQSAGCSGNHPHASLIHKEHFIIYHLRMVIWSIACLPSSPPRPVSRAVSTPPEYHAAGDRAWQSIGGNQCA